jgi:hypothetical protein
MNLKKIFGKSKKIFYLFYKKLIDYQNTFKSYRIKNEKTDFSIIFFRYIFFLR